MFYGIISFKKNRNLKISLLLTLITIKMSEDISIKTCDCGSNRSLDIRTPRNVHLSPFYKRSFAFDTVKYRIPVILTNLIDNLVRNKKQIVERYGEESMTELKTIIGELSELKYEIQTNKPLKLLTSDAPDIEIYNDYIKKQSMIEGHTTHFHTIWLLTEAYMYRRIKQLFETKEILNNYDYFEHYKREAFTGAFSIIKKMAELIVNILNDGNPAKSDVFHQLVKLNLWGNKCDLSLSLGEATDTSGLFDTSAMDNFILCDHSKLIWDTLSTDEDSDIVDVIFDNSGYEVFTDLCLADYMITKGLAKSIRLYVKTMQWFISDVMEHDLYWTIEQLKNHKSDENLETLGHRWSQYLEDGTWTVVSSDFWTLPFDYTYMATINPQLYKQLSQAKLVIFKGDANYRKLFGERNWDPATPVDVALQMFHPTKLCTIRTVKADIVCGLPDGVADELERKDEKWMEKGDFGVIQFSNKKILIE